MFITFSNIKNIILINSKKPGGVFFCRYPFLNVNKKHTYESENSWHSFFGSTHFNYQKSILTNLKIPGTVFCLCPFQILKKAYLRISKYLAQFFTFPLLKYSKNETYESQNTWHSFFHIPFSNIKKSIVISSKNPSTVFFLLPI